MNKDDDSILENRQEFLLSVCIPTYKRDQIVYDCVRQILRHENADLEVVVGDNCSPDKTRELIASVKDERLSYFRNDTNIGYVNIMETMKHAHGDYCILLSDEDDLVMENITRLNRLLKEHVDASVMVTGIEWLHERTLIFSAGREAVFQNALNMPGYMSGLIFHRESVMRCLGRIHREELFFLLFPHQYAGILCCMEGGLVLTGSKFVRIGVRRGKTDNEAQKARTTGVHWEPASRLQQASGRYKVLHDCELGLKTRLHLGLILLKRDTISSSIGFYKIIHEDMTSWNMSEEKLAELFQIGQQPKKFWHRMIRKNYKEIRGMLEKELLEKSLLKSLLRYPQYLALYLKGKMKIWLEEKRQIR